LNLKEIDTEDITTQVRSIKGLKMVLFFKEMENNTYRVSLRSKGKANSALVAESFGGGGHVHAAGFTVSGDYNLLMREIPEKVEQILAQNENK
jgi:phosphoesterase RecJ-like protein